MHLRFEPEGGRGAGESHLRFEPEGGRGAGSMVECSGMGLLEG